MVKKEGELDSTTNNQSETKFQLWPNRSVVNTYNEISSTELVEKLKSNALESKYLEMHKHYKSFVETSSLENKVAYDKLKEGLELLTIPAKVHPKRQTEDMVSFNNLIILDFDYKDNKNVITDIKAIKKQIAQDEHTFMAFISPNGFGLKVIFRTLPFAHIDSFNDSLSDKTLRADKRMDCIRWFKGYYKCGWNQASTYMLDKYKLVADKSNSYVLGATYVSADSEPYLNVNSKLFEISELTLEKEKIQPTIEETPNVYSSSNYEILGEIESFISHYHEGRHNKTMYITLQANYYQIPKHEIVDYCWQSFGATDHPIYEIKRTVESFYGLKYNGTQYKIKEIFNKDKCNYYYGY